jgi:hypothetical protein
VFVRFLAITPNDQAVVAPTDFGVLRLIDLRTGQVLREFRGQTYDMPFAAMSHDGERIASLEQTAISAYGTLNSAERDRPLRLPNLINAIEIVSAPTTGAWR